MQPLPHDAHGTDGVLGARRDRGEARGAPGDRLLALEDVALQVAELVGLELEAQVELHADIGVLAEGAAAARPLEHPRLPGRRCPGRLRWNAAISVGDFTRYNLHAAT